MSQRPVSLSRKFKKLTVFKKLLRFHFTTRVSISFNWQHESDGIFSSNFWRVRV